MRLNGIQTSRGNTPYQPAKKTNTRLSASTRIRRRFNKGKLTRAASGQTRMGLITTSSPSDGKVTSDKPRCHITPVRSTSSPPRKALLSPVGGDKLLTLDQFLIHVGLMLLSTAPSSA